MTRKRSEGWPCDHTFHLWKSGGLKLAAYDKLGAMTYRNPDREYFSTGRALAQFFGATENHMTKLLRELCAEGWLLCTKPTRPFNAPDYQRIEHKEWVKTHPNSC